jgi:hypothetical protein
VPCRSWRAVSGLAARMCRPARPGARSRRPCPSPRQCSASRCSPPSQTPPAPPWPGRTGSTQSARCSRSAGAIRPRSHVSFCSSTQSNVSCFRWMSRPPTIDIGTSSSSVTIDVQRRRTAASELRRPPKTAGRQDLERRTPRLNPPTVTGRCMSSHLPLPERGLSEAVTLRTLHAGAAHARHQASVPKMVRSQGIRPVPSARVVD